MSYNGEPGRAQQVGSDMRTGRHVLHPAAQSRQQRVCFAKRNQPAVPFQQLEVSAFPAKPPSEDAIEKGGFLLWVGSLRIPAKSFELFFSVFQQCRCRLRLAVIRKEIERCLFAI